MHLVEGVGSRSSVLVVWGTFCMMGLIERVGALGVV